MTTSASTSDTILLGGTYSTTNSGQSSVTFEVYGVTDSSSIGSQSSGAGAGKLTFVPLGTETVHLVHGFGIIAFAATAVHDASHPFTQFELEDTSTKAFYAVNQDATATDTSPGAMVRLGEYTLFGSQFSNFFGGLLTG